MGMGMGMGMGGGGMGGGGMGDGEVVLGEGGGGVRLMSADEIAKALESDNQEERIRARAARIEQRILRRKQKKEGKGELHTARRHTLTCKHTQTHADTR